MTNTKTYRVTIPASDMHEGIYTIDVVLNWICPVCGAERGVLTTVASYDGSRRLHCDGWINPCGHIDKYADVRREASTNGLNDDPRIFSPQPFKDRLLHLRKAAGLSRQELADKSGFKRNDIRDYEQGRAIPGIARRMTLALFLNVNCYAIEANVTDLDQYLTREA